MVEEAVCVNKNDVRSATFNALFFVSRLLHLTCTGVLVMEQFLAGLILSVLASFRLSCSTLWARLIRKCGCLWLDSWPLSLVSLDFFEYLVARFLQLARY